MELTAKVTTSVYRGKLDHDLLVVLMAAKLEDALAAAGRDMGALLKTAGLEKSLVRAYGLMLSDEAFKLLRDKYLAEHADVRAIYESFRQS